jgi:hypothetical protein
MQRGTFQRSFSLPLSNRRKSRHGEYFKRGRGLQGYRGGNTRPQFGGLKKEQNRLQQQIFMSNMIMTTRQQALVSLMRLQALGVSDMDSEYGATYGFDSILSLKEKNNGNTNNNGWPKF